MTEERFAEYAAAKEDKWFDDGPCWYVPLPSDPILFRCFPDTNVNKTEILRCARPEAEGGGWYAYDSKGKIQLDDPNLQLYYKPKKSAINGYVPNDECKTTDIQTIAFQARPTQVFLLSALCPSPWRHSTAVLFYLTCCCDHCYKFMDCDNS